jgi:HEAT repeat protein
VSVRFPKLYVAALVAAGLVPTLGVAHRAFAGDSEDDGDDDTEVTASTDLTKKKRLTLAAIPGDETALINVTAREMPASPDLLNLGKRSTKALARCVADNVDDKLRYTCASLLGRIGDRAALPALQGALEAWSPRVRGAAIEALRRIPDATSFEPLKKILERKDEELGNKGAALEALGTLSDKRALPLLRTALRDEKAGLSFNAFRGLFRSRHLMGRDTLIGDVKHALGRDDVQLQVEATFAAAELRAPELVSAIVPLMESTDKHLRNRAVYALGRIGDKVASTALLAQVPKVREARMLNNIAFALERLDPKAFYKTAEGLIDHKQAAIRMNAAFVLGDVKRPEGLPLLERALADKNDYVRVSAVAAIGNLDAPEAMPLIEKLVDDPNPSLRKAAIYSLFALSDGAKKDVVYNNLYAGALGKKEPWTRLEAAITLGKAGDLRVAPDLIACVESRRCRLSEVDGFLRTAAVPEIPGRMLLTWAKGRMELTDLIGTLKPPGAGPLAVSAIQSSLALGETSGTAYDIDLAGDLGEATAVGVLKPLLLNESTRLRLHAAVALAREGVVEADAIIFKDFDNVPEDRLPLVARLLGRIKEPAVRKRLEPELVKREKATGPGTTALALAAADVRFLWDAESSFFRFLDGLASPASMERDLAVKYLRRDRRAAVTGLMRRALAREERPVVRDLLRKLLDLRAGFDVE